MSADPYTQQAERIANGYPTGGTRAMQNVGPVYGTAVGLKRDAKVVNVAIAGTSPSSCYVDTRVSLLEHVIKCQAPVIITKRDET